jgi:hypothetical protein
MTPPALEGKSKSHGDLPDEEDNLPDLFFCLCILLVSCRANANQKEAER